jgi:ribonucleotide monophosphatase NagD (HAD superfamily)
MNRSEMNSEKTMTVGDRMDTDVVAGIEAGLETILVLAEGAFLAMTHYERGFWDMAMSG